MHQPTLIAPSATPSVFKFNTHKVRVVMRDGEPWFVAADVAAALGYRNAPDAARNLPDHQKSSTQIVRSTSGGNPNVTIISEGGLYRLVLRSRKPEAEAFTDWVTSEVLPSIRKTGGYGQLDEDRLNAAYALASEVAAQASRTVFKAVMEGSDSWRHGRWVFALAWNGKDDWDKPWAKAIANDAMVGTPEDLAKMIEGPDLFIDTHRLATLGSACAARVAQTLAYQKKMDKFAKKEISQ